MSDNYIITYSGRKFYLDNPRPEDIDINDIAHALSRMPRFCGHTTGGLPYSVAQHSVEVSLLVPAKYALRALLHDASEAYLLDIPTPLKRLLADLYRPLESRVMEAIYNKFGLEDTEDSHSAIKYADHQMFMLEGNLMMAKPEEYGTPASHIRMHTGELFPEEAKGLFLNHFLRYNTYPAYNE